MVRHIVQMLKKSLQIFTLCYRWNILQSLLNLTGGLPHPPPATHAFAIIWRKNWFCPTPVVRSLGPSSRTCTSLKILREKINDADTSVKLSRIRREWRIVKNAWSVWVPTSNKRAQNMRSLNRQLGFLFWVIFKRNHCYMTRICMTIQRNRILKDKLWCKG